MLKSSDAMNKKPPLCAIGAEIGASVSSWNLRFRPSLVTEYSDSFSLAKLTMSPQGTGGVWIVLEVLYRQATVWYDHWGSKLCSNSSRIFRRSKAYALPSSMPT